MSKNKPSKNTTAKNRQTNNTSVLDSITKTTKDKVIECAKKRKSILFVSGNKEQKKTLAKLAYSICRGKKPCEISQLVTIDCINYEDIQEFHDDIDIILNGAPFILTDVYLKAEENQMKYGGDLIPERYGPKDIVTLFIDNLDSIADDNILRKVANLANYKFTNWENKSFKPLIIVYSTKKSHDWFKREFEEITLSPKPKQQKSKCRIPDDKFTQLCKEVEKEIGTRESSNEIIFFKKLSEMSKLTKYDKTCRGHKTWQSAKKRYYEVFPSKKAKH